MDGHWSEPRPRIAVAGDEILVTDPNASQIHRIDAVAFEPSGTIAVDGLPMGIVAAAAPAPSIDRKGPPFGAVPPAIRQGSSGSAP